MKTAELFWNVIGDYNQSTVAINIIFSTVTIGILLYAQYRQGVGVSRLMKLWFGIESLYIAVVFFFIHDGSGTALLLGGPLFIIISALLILDSMKPAVMRRANPVEIVLYSVISLYPMFSFILGHEYPRMVLPLMPCPLVSYILVTYTRYEKRNLILELLLVFWAVTGLPKAVIFNVPEDIILFLAGIYFIVFRYIEYKKKCREQITGTGGFER